MNAAASANAISFRGDTEPGVRPLQRDEELNRFLAEVECRALRIAEISVRNTDDALDLVQEAMIKPAQKYAHKDRADWPPLFWRILQNGVRDHLRRQAVRNRARERNPERPRRPR